MGVSVAKFKANWLAKFIWLEGKLFPIAKNKIGHQKYLVESGQDIMDKVRI